MNKIIAWILILCMVCSMAACNKSGEKENTSGAENTVHAGLSVEILEVRREENDVILEVLWKNETQYDIVYGEMFGIHRWEDGQWIPLEMKENTAFQSIGYGLEAGKKVQKTYNLGWVYDLSLPGTYRFSTECYLYDTREGSKCHLYDEFTLPVNTENQGLPQLSVYSGTEEVQVATGGYSWAQYEENGMVTMTHADSLHPLQMEKHLTNYQTTNDRVRLNFSRQPDSWEVRCWPDHMLRDGDVTLFDSQSESVMVYDEQLHLKPAVDGGYIYEITARWEESPNQSYGTVTYVFWINSYPVEPITNEIMPR